MAVAGSTRQECARRSYSRPGSTHAPEINLAQPSFIGHSTLIDPVERSGSYA